MRKMFVAGFGAAMVAAAVVGFAPVSNAQMDVIKERQEAMKAVGGAIKKLGAIAKGEAAFDAAVVSEAGNTIHDNFVKAATLFPEGSMSDDSYAKEEIWQDFDGFKAALEKGIAASKAIASTDEAGFKAALGDLGGSCKGCHEKFRRPKS